MCIVVEIMARTMRLQLKFVRRSATLAIRTWVLINLRRYQLSCASSAKGDELTISLACSFSAIASLFASISSSRNVGLRGPSIVRAAIPGDFMALLRGLEGVSGMFTAIL